MVDALRPFAWWEGMKNEADKWHGSCRVCSGRSRFPRTSATLRSVSALRPFSTLIYDLVFVTPAGEHKEVGCMTAICVYTRYIWLKPIWGKSAKDAAWALFSIICDAGVTPLKLLSDRDPAFRDRVVLELTSLFRSK